VDPYSCMTPGKERLYTLPFFTMAFANLCNLTSFGAFFLFPLFVTQRGGDQVDVGVIMGAFALASVICRPWISEMIDRMGRKWTFTLGAIVMTLMPLTYTTLRGNVEDFLWLLIVFRVIHGVGFAISLTAAFTFVADLVPPSRLNEGVGMFGVSGLTGAALGPVIGEWIINYSGFTSLFHIAAIIPFVGLLAQLFLTETHSRTARVVSHSFFKVLAMPRILLVAALSFLFGVGIAASNGFVSPYASEMRVAFISVYFMAYSAAAIVTRFAGSRIADQYGEEKVIPYAMFIAGTGFFLLVFLGGEILLLCAGLLAGCGHGFLFPSLNALALRGAQSHSRGKITGAFTGSIDAGVFAGSLILGLIGEYFGFRVLFLTASLALWTALLLFRFQTWRHPHLLLSSGRDKC